MKHVRKLSFLAVVSCASLTYGQLDPGDCGLAGSTLQFCSEAGAACTASDGKSGTCVQQRQGCHCAPHNICHLDRTTQTYSAMRVGEKGMGSHLRHGDCLIDDGVYCTIDRCDATLGCVHTTDDARCDDGLFCTTEACTAAGCDTVSTCPPAIDGCVRVNDSCDEDNDVCVDRPDDSLCDDGDLCDGVDVCDPATGECTVDYYLFCDDFSRCTADSCDPATGCVFAPVSCDDGSPCTTDSCNALLGCQHTPVDCNDGNFCNGLDACDPATGDCVIDAYLFCDDFSRCTADSCDPATGCVFAPVSCDDENACTTDSCNPLFGCQHENTVVCDQECRGEECDPASGACGPVLANGTACDDGNECTVGDACNQAICVGTPCSASQTCCAGAGCVELSSNNAHCGTCGNICQNSVCFQGSCYNGCVIGGVAYPNGTRNPGNDCQACNTSVSRTSWVNLGSNPSGPFETCHVGCFTGFCIAGACGSLGGSGGCQSTTCAAASCVNSTCAYTPQNEGAACTPPLSTSVCRSGVTGTCQNGQCAGAVQNEGGFCIPEASSVPGDGCWSSSSGTCSSTGQCVPNRTTGASCFDPVLYPCRTGECKDQFGSYGCWFVTTNPACASPHDYCGPDGTCNAQTQQCSYPGPFDDPPDGLCGNFETGPKSEECCPGQVCACPPSVFGPVWCIAYYCYWPEELEGPG